MKFIGNDRAGSAAFRVGSVEQMEGTRFRLCASPLSHACAKGLDVADEFHESQLYLKQFCNSPLCQNPVAGRCRAYPLPRWKEKVHTFNSSSLFRGIRWRLLKKVNCKIGHRNLTCSTDCGAGCGLQAREACPSFSPPESQYRIRRPDKKRRSRRDVPAADQVSVSVFVFRTVRQTLFCCGL